MDLLIRIINESFNNFPSWLKTFLGHNKYVPHKLNKLGIDLANANVEEVNSPRDPRLKDADSVVFVNLATATHNKLSRGDGVYIYKPQSPGYLTISDVYVSDGKYASKMSNKSLLSIADNFAILSISQNKKPHKDRYKDPRKQYKGWDDNKGTYAGQTYHDYTQRYGYNPEKDPSGEWISGSGRDKSGYVIPDPAKLVGKMYEFDLDTAANTLDNYYKKLSKIKNRIFNLDVRSLGSDYSDHYDTLLRYFGRASQDFLKLEKKINRILNNVVGSEKWNKRLAEDPNADPNELFKEYTGYDYDKRDLDDYIKELQSRLKDLENV